MTQSEPLLLDEVPLFSLPGLILLPRAQLPLRIFEPHYVAMLDYALGHGRQIAIVQPREALQGAPSSQPPLYDVGCIGRITTFAEAESGQFLLSLSGTRRFKITGESVKPEGFRCVTCDFAPYPDDLKPPAKTDIDRARLTGTLRLYCEIYGVSANWDVVQNLPADDLLATLAMICPFAPSEKQALLESPTPQACAQTLATLLEMACLRQDENAPTPRH